jgi:RNA polymerase sigma factor (sigma-70 family)
MPRDRHGRAARHTSAGRGGIPETTGINPLEAVFRRQYGRLCALAAALTGDKNQAEDLVMDAFARVSARNVGIAEPPMLAAYVQVAVVNRTRDALRRRGVESRANAVYAGRQPSEAYGIEPPDHEVLAAIGSLPARQQAAVVLRYYSDLSEPEIARILGCTTGTVKSQLAKARRHLARVIASHDRR